RDPLAPALGGDQELEKPSLGLVDLLGKGGVAVQTVEPSRLLAGAELVDPVTNGFAVFDVARIDAQRAAVGGELLDVEEGQSVSGENPLDRQQREIREMLVIDRIELVLLDEPHQVRELDGGHTAR